MWWIAWAICGLAVVRIIRNTISFYKNLQWARGSGLPYVWSPCGRLDFLWILVHKPLKPLLRRLPSGLGGFGEHNALGWWFDGDYQTLQLHRRLGKTFINVTPGMSELHVADPDVAQQVFKRKWDFDRDADQMSHAKFFGESLVSVTGQEWARHRRISAAPFNENIHELVWNEAVRQTRQMSEYWSCHGEEGFSTALEDLNTVTLNVFAKASLGRAWDFCKADDIKRRAQIEGEFDATGSNAAMAATTWTYRDSLFFVTHNIVAYVMLPDWLLAAPAWVVPPPLKRFVTAWRDLGEYFRRAVDKTKEQIRDGDAQRNPSVISYLVSKSEEVRREEAVVSGSKGKPQQGFKDSDIYGTLFALNQTGHDTSKSVLGSAIYLLAAYPDLQDWICEQLVSVDPAGNKVYVETFHRLTRCLAVMNESLRLYPPIPMVYRSTIGPAGQDLVIDGRTVHIPPKTFVIPNITAAATHPEFWGDLHNTSWRPRRWIDPATDELRSPSSVADAFFPFAAGPRGCIGKKFAQVEFVAILSTLLTGYRIVVVPRAGEGIEAARERCADTVRWSEMELTVQMTDASSVTLRLIAR
ncbi:hypothetical protein ACKVV1_011442 [Pyricularia oryzae]